MREENPLSLFVPWTEAITKAQPSLAFVHAVGPRALGSIDTPKHLENSDDCLDVIREVVSKAGVKLITAGGFLPDTAMQHTIETDDLVAFGRYFICRRASMVVVVVVADGLTCNSEPRPSGQDQEWMASSQVRPINILHSNHRRIHRVRDDECDFVGTLHTDHVAASLLTTRDFEM